MDIKKEKLTHFLKVMGLVSYVPALKCTAQVHLGLVKWCIKVYLPFPLKAWCIRTMDFRPRFCCLKIAKHQKYT